MFRWKPNLFIQALINQESLLIVINSSETGKSNTDRSKLKHQRRKNDSKSMFKY